MFATRWGGPAYQCAVVFMPLVPDSSVTRSRRVRVNTRLLGGASFSDRRAPETGSTVALNLFGDARFVAVLRIPPFDGGYT